MTNETVKIACVVLPDGRIGFMPENRDTIGACIKSWKDGLTDDQKIAHKFANTLGGVVIVTMLKSDYENIPAMSQFPWPETG